MKCAQEANISEYPSLSDQSMGEISYSLKAPIASSDFFSSSLITIIQVFTDMRRECLTLESSAAA